MKRKKEPIAEDPVEAELVKQKKEPTTEELVEIELAKQKNELIIRQDRQQVLLEKKGRVGKDGMTMDEMAELFELTNMKSQMQIAQKEERIIQEIRNKKPK